VERPTRPPKTLARGSTDVGEHSIALVPASENGIVLPGVSPASLRRPCGDRVADESCIGPEIGRPASLRRLSGVCRWLASMYATNDRPATGKRPKSDRTSATSDSRRELGLLATGGGQPATDERPTLATVEACSTSELLARRSVSWCLDRAGEPGEVTGAVGRYSTKEPSGMTKTRDATRSAAAVPVVVSAQAATGSTAAESSVAGVSRQVAATGRKGGPMTSIPQFRPRAVGRRRAASRWSRRARWAAAAARSPAPLQVRAHNHMPGCVAPIATPDPIHQEVAACP
jgi:hypothetical protein